MFSRCLFISLLLVLFITVSCQISSVEDTPASVQDIPQTLSAQSSMTAEMEAEQSTLEAKKVESQQLTADAQATLDAEFTIEAKETAAVYNKRTKEAENILATKTQTRSILLTNTAEAEMEDKLQVDALLEKLQVSYDEGVLPNLDGTFHRLEDFDESVAKINYLTWWETGYEPENFVIRVDAYWDAASELANWNSSGCAFVFGFADAENFNFTWLGLDSFANLQRMTNGNWQWIAQRPNGKLSYPEGEAEIMMVVFDKRIVIYVNGEEELNEYDPLYKQGKLALSVYSGINTGFGTRCKMSNIDLMIFE